MGKNGRNAQTLLLTCLVLALLWGCGVTKKEVAPPEPWPEAPQDKTCRSVVRTAMDMIGAPYRYGGEKPTGFDCSGLTTYIFSRHGYELPRRAQDQLQAGRWAPRGNLRPGDLVFFKISSQQGWHVGLYIGGDLFIHAPGVGKRVEVQSLSHKYYRRSYYTARRILDGC
ncbi:MAG: C40 family peptidase [Pseudomonadota bacterium]